MTSLLWQVNALLEYINLSFQIDDSILYYTAYKFNKFHYVTGPAKTGHVAQTTPNYSTGCISVLEKSLCIL